MSRSGYNEDCEDNWRMIMWRGTVTSSIRGKRGQAFLRDMIAALDAMPEKRLIANSLIQKGEVCAIGSLGVARGVNMEGLDPEDYDRVSKAFNVASPLAREVVWHNDEGGRRTWNEETKKWEGESPEARWTRMRKWAEDNLVKVKENDQPAGDANV